jgi:hypothetical protein
MRSGWAERAETLRFRADAFIDGAFVEAVSGARLDSGLPTEEGHR